MLNKNAQSPLINQFVTSKHCFSQVPLQRSIAGAHPISVFMLESQWPAVCVLALRTHLISGDKCSTCLSPVTLLLSQVYYYPFQRHDHFLISCILNMTLPWYHAHPQYDTFLISYILGMPLPWYHMPFDINSHHLLFPCNKRKNNSIHSYWYTSNLCYCSFQMFFAMDFDHFQRPNTEWHWLQSDMNAAEDNIYKDLLVNCMQL